MRLHRKKNSWMFAICVCFRFFLTIHIWCLLHGGERLFVIQWFYVGSFFYFNFISAKQFISVLCSHRSFPLCYCVSYPTEYILLRIKVQLLLSVYNTHIHTFLFSTTSTSMTLHCSVNIYIISIFAFAFLLWKFAFSRSLFVPVSFRPLMVLVSCYQGCLTAANLRAISALTLCKTQRLTTLILILYALTT